MKLCWHKWHRYTKNLRGGLPYWNNMRECEKCGKIQRQHWEGGWVTQKRIKDT